ncbi:hypothetical protein SS50377_23541 [Spironucleus salmonicida]|uniref:Uncharacterized protein n=1 Tax=Spironucleus salmonicida TaxID=348837 RepID=V6LW99_9EUKA|nr:hypothetical protein SS50377_23541 [Spironucleus salmonicida]|eukprot:EST48523.1 hypothetical protein SS50377_11133 [Spironucleus salmonicida]
MSNIINIDDVVQNNQINLQKFFEFSFLEGVPVTRFVDDMSVNWQEVAQNIGRSADECRAQYQFLLDQLFERSEFKKQDREELYMLITMKLISFKRVGVVIGDDDIERIQSEYFPDYSAEVLRMEITAALENFKQFLEEQNK